METNLLVQIFTLVTLILGFCGAWFREGRIREWQKTDARELAEKLAADTREVASKVNADALELAAKVNREAALTAAKVVADAKEIAMQLHTRAERLSDKVTENTLISTKAVIGAEAAYTEANSVNNKIAQLQENLLRVTDHIARASAAAVLAEKAAQEEALFNQRVKQAIDRKLLEMNSEK